MLRSGDYTGAARALRAAAASGHVSALYNLALMYKQGLTESFEIEKAIDLFKQAAERGHEQARLQVALFEQCPLLAIGTLPARASVTESTFFDDLPGVLSASRLSQPVNEAPAAVTVIDQDMIRASGFHDIPDLFRLVPGFTVAYTRDNSRGVGYHGLADAFSRRMQVLIDGRSVYTAGFGEVPWASLPLSIEDIERIEVVRGPNSAAYGSNAFMGIINIITKEASQVPGGHLSVQAGEQDMAGASYRYGGGSDDLRYRLTLSDQRRDRFDTQAEKTTTRHLDMRMDYRLSARDEITATFALSRGDWRQGVVENPDFIDPVRSLDVGSEHLQVKFRHVHDPENEWSLQFYHTRLRKEDDFTAPTPFGGVPVDYGTPSGARTSTGGSVAVALLGRFCEAISAGSAL